MKAVNGPLPGLLIIEPNVIKDARGYFFESFRLSDLTSYGIKAGFVQDNESCSVAGVLRGLHFQETPHAQAKLVRVISGSALDVVVDLRKSSPCYGKHFLIILSGENKKLLFIPEGFAHGFLTLEDNTVFNYKCSAYYCKESEKTILWNDKDLDIQWNVENPVISPKDTHGMKFSDYRSCFE